MSFLLSLWGRFQGWLIAAGAALAILIAAYVKGRNDQSTKVENKELKNRIESVKKSKEVSDEVRKMSPSDVDSALDRFMRD